MAVKESLTPVEVNYQPINPMDLFYATSTEHSESHPVGGFTDVLSDSDGWQIVMPKEIGDGEYVLASREFLAASDVDESVEEDSTVETSDNDNDTAVETTTGKEKSRLRDLGRKLGTKALYGTVALGVTASILGPKAVTIFENKDAFKNISTLFDSGDHIRTVAANVDMQPRTTPFANVMVTGGNSQTTAPLPEMMAKGYVGPDARSNDYPASMSPWASPPGSPSTGESVAEGSQHLVDFYNANHAQGKNTQFVGYSLGTMVTYQALQEIKAQNGGQWPADLDPPIIAGAPQIHGGILGPESPWAGLGDMGLGVGKTDPHPFPPGTVVYYYHDDVFAGSGNENFMTMLHDAFGTAAGGHELPDLNNPNTPHKDFVDKDGVIHRVYYHENGNDVIINALQKAGLNIMDTADANAAMNALFPHNDDPNSTVQPEADVKAAMTFGARALDRQVDPSGSFHLFEDVVANMPDQWKNMLNTDWNGINHIADAVAEAANDPSKIPQAITTVMSELSKMMTGFNTFTQGDIGAQVENMGVTSLGQVIHDYTGQDVTPQLQNLTQTFNQMAQNYQAQQQQQQQAAAQAQIQSSVNGQIPAMAFPTPSRTAPNPSQVIPQGPESIPQITVNGNGSATTTITVPPMTVAPVPKPAEAPSNPAPAPTGKPEATPPIFDTTTPPEPTHTPTPTQQPRVHQPVVTEAPAPVITPDVPAPVPVRTQPAPEPAPVAPAEVAPPAPIITFAPAPPIPAFTPAPAESIPQPTAPIITLPPILGGSPVPHTTVPSHPSAGAPGGLTSMP